MQAIIKFNEKFSGVNLQLSREISIIKSRFYKNILQIKTNTFLLANARKIVIQENTKEEQLDNISFNSIKLLKAKNSVKNQDGIEETIRIYATDEMLDILIDKNYDQFFIDGTFKCVPKGLNNYFLNE